MLYEDKIKPEAFKKVRKLIDENKEKLNANDFGFFYEKFLSLSYPLSCNCVRTFTILLINAGIPFLNYMYIVPDYCFDNLDITEIVIPDNITIVGHYSFYHCSQLSKVVLPKDLSCLANSVFVRCPKLKEIEYKGTVKDWKNLSKYTVRAYHNKWEIKERTPSEETNWGRYIIKCSDGDYKRVTL